MWKHKDDALCIIADLIDKDAVNGKEALKLAIAVLYDNNKIPIEFIDGEPVESPKPIEEAPKPLIIKTDPITNPNINEIKIGDVIPDPWTITCTHPDKIDAIAPPGMPVIYDGFASSITGEVKASESVGAYSGAIEAYSDNTKDCLGKTLKFFDMFVIYNHKHKN